MMVDAPLAYRMRCVMLVTPVVNYTSRQCVSSSGIDENQGKENRGESSHWKQMISTVGSQRRHVGR